MVEVFEIGRQSPPVGFALRNEALWEPLDGGALIVIPAHVGDPACRSIPRRRPFRSVYDKPIKLCRPDSNTAF
jgi:hypothetical protein